MRCWVNFCRRLHRGILMQKSRIALFALAGVAAVAISVGIVKDALPQASGGGGSGKLQMFDGFNNAIGSTGSGASRAINFNCTNCGTGGGGPAGTITFPAAVINGVSGGIPCFTSTTVMSSTSMLQANNIVVGSGVGNCPVTAATGNNVLAALGVNIGVAGSIVINGGVLGTPTGGNLVNETGYLAGNLSGLGTGVPAALGASVGSVGGIVISGGALGTPSSGNLVNTTGYPLGALTGLGTGVQTALSANVGVAGSVVTNGGVLGKPTTGDVSNTTGYPLGALTGLASGVSTILAAPPNSAGGLMSVSPTAAGDLAIWNGTAWTKLAGNAGAAKVLQEAAGVASWVTGGGSAGVTTTCPPSTASSTLDNTLQLIAKTANYTTSTTPASSVADCGAIVTFTITAATTYQLPAAASLPRGWGIGAVINSPLSTAPLTVSAAGGTFTYAGGAASITLQPKSVVPIWTDQTNWFNGNGAAGLITEFFATGSWTPSPLTVRFRYDCMGGGGGGGGGGAALGTGLIYGGASGGGGAAKTGNLTIEQLHAFYPTGSIPVTVTLGGAPGVGSSNGNGTSGATGGTASLGNGANVICTANGGGGGGGGGPAGSAGGGGAGLWGNGFTATANSTSVGNGGTGGGTPGVAGSGFATSAPWCAGSGGTGTTITTGAARTGAQAAQCTSQGPSGAGVASAGAGLVGFVGIAPFGAPSSNSLYTSGTAGAVAGNGGDGATGIWATGTFLTVGDGVIGGASGGSGGSCVGVSCVPGNAGNSGYGASGAGGGACQTPSATCTGGTGGQGGQPFIQITEYMTP
jgi:hypothetical protein